MAPEHAMQTNACWDRHDRMATLPQPNQHLLTLLACHSRLDGIDANGQLLAPIVFHLQPSNSIPMFLATTPTATSAAGTRHVAGWKIPIRAVALSTFRV